MATQVFECNTFEQFIEELRGRESIRLVKLSDVGFVSPVKSSTGAWVMVPQLKLVATAYDNRSGLLIRWQSTNQDRSKASIAMETVHGSHGDIQIAAKREDLQKWLELEGYSVSEGEWTTAELDRLLARKQAV